MNIVVISRETWRKTRYKYVYDISHLWTCENGEPHSIVILKILDKETPVVIDLLESVIIISPNEGEEE